MTFTTTRATAMQPTPPALTGRPTPTRATLIAVGNEVVKGLRFGWAERRQILLELTLMVPMFFILAAVAGQGDAIVADSFEWVFDDRRTAWLFIGFGFAMFFFLHVQKFFWRQLAEIQGGTLEQVYLSPLPWWVLAAVGRVLASIVEAVVVVGIMYTSVALTVGVDIDWRPLGLVPVAFLAVGAVGHSLLVGGLTLVWKRVELVNELLLLVLLGFGGVYVALDDMPDSLAAFGRILPITHPIDAGRAVLLGGSGLTLGGDGGVVWMAVLAAVWFAAGITVFHRASQIVRRDGTLTTDKQT